MAQKMVTSFRRSLSFPNPPAHNSSKIPRKTLHVRSTSLPCRSHPIISQLRDQISQLSSWSSATADARTSDWLCDGLLRLKSVHESLDDLLHLPQTRESLRGGGACADLAEKFLEDLLRFVDIYGTFQTLALRLKEEFSAAQIAVRRREDPKIASQSKNLSRIAKEIGKLASINFVSVGKLSGAAPAGAPYDDQAEMIGAINDVLKVTVSVSALLFGGLSVSSAFRKPSSGMSFGVKSKNLRGEGGIREFQEMDLGNMRKKKDEEMKMVMKKMHDVEDRILEIEGCAERAFRSLIHTRVSLLNVVTQ